MLNKTSVKNILNDKQADSLVSKLIYSIEDIQSCSYDKNTKEICIECIDDSHFDRINIVVDEMIENEKNIRAIGTRIIKTQDKKSNYSRINSDEISRIFAKDGSVRSGLAETLYSKFDSIFREIGDKYNAGNRRYPSTISRSVMDICNYTTSFPQNAYFVSELPHNKHVLDKVKSTNNINELIKPNGYMLSPAVCFHCYKELMNNKLNGPVVLTAEASCFRHEAEWRIGNQRLIEFSMREIVYFGEADFVQNIRNEIMEEVWRIFNDLGFNGRIETAHDPFYFPQDASKGLHQLIADMKYELIVEIPNSNISFAIASFNNVKDTLCREFKVFSSSDNEPLHSGCVAFGIDRWVYAALSTFGTDIENYPTLLSDQQ